MNNKISAILLIVVTIVLGITGYLQLGTENLYGSFLRTMQNFQINFNVFDSNLFVEISRWLAILLVAKAMFLILGELKENWKIWFLAIKNNSVAIHGDSVYCEPISHVLETNAIYSKSKVSLKAKNHIILFHDDKDSLDFFSIHEKELGKAEHIYLGLNTLHRESLENSKVSVFSMAENCARQYWEEYPVGSSEKIVIIGSGEYAEKLLTHGLITNVLSIDGGMQYHTFGDFKRYSIIHTELSKFLAINKVEKNRDSMFLHEMPWYKNLEILRNASRIILCGESEENIQIANEIIFTNIKSKIFLRVNNEKTCELLFLKEKVVPFGTIKQLCLAEHVLREKLMENSKKIHAAYMRKYSDVCEACQKEIGGNCLDCKEFVKDWSGNLSTFKRYSNVAVADHIPIKLRLLGLDKNMINSMKNEKLNELWDNFTDKKKRELQEIEHIRWNRYHFMNNWQYDEIRDDSECKHPSLTPYSELTKEEQDKDAENYLILGNIEIS